MNDETGGEISLKQLIKFVGKCKDDLYDAKEDDAALRFEILETWLREDVASGTPFTYDSKSIGI